jgi:hypothetical protein
VSEPIIQQHNTQLVADDIKFSTDMTRLFHLLAVIENTCRITDAPLHDIDDRWSWDLHVEIAQTQCNWPDDQAATMLTNWARARATA